MISHSFQVTALNPDTFLPMFSMDDDSLRTIHARRMIVDQFPGFPCRVSLEDAAIGEEVVLVHYKHHDVASPYQASGPIFIRKNAAPAQLGVNELPKVFHGRRFLALRGYDAQSMLVGATTVMGSQVESEILLLLANSAIQYIHVHSAAYGCYHCRIDRVV